MKNPNICSDGRKERSWLHITTTPFNLGSEPFDKSQVAKDGHTWPKWVKAESELRVLKIDWNMQIFYAMKLINLEEKESC